LSSSPLPARPLGRTGLALPVIWAGTATIGGIGSDPALRGLGLDPAAAPALLDAAEAAGVRVIDTADSYTGGTSERTVGAWLQHDPARAAEMIVATKTGVRTPYPTRDLRPEHVERAAEESRRRLGVSRLKLFMSHRPDPEVPATTVMATFASLIERGVVEHVGACNVTAAQIADLLAAAEKLGGPRIEWVQNRFNVVVAAAEADVLALCRQEGLGYVAHSVLAGGVLGGRRAEDPVPAGSRLAVKPEVYDRYRTPAASRAIARFGASAGELGVPVAALAQAWVLAVPGVSGLVAGPQRPEHVAASVTAAEMVLAPRQQAELGELFAEAFSA
jgi:aryl-alcohol dehydrogenase-like predicted oxidoreductase